MARRKFVVGNWKMHGLHAQLPEIGAIAKAAEAAPGIDTALCVPFTLIERAAAVAGAMPIGAPAQTMSVSEKSGRRLTFTKITIATSTPRSPPWNAIPPFQTFRISAGLAK